MAGSILLLGEHLKVVVFGGWGLRNSDSLPPGVQKYFSIFNTVSIDCTFASTPV